MGVFDLFGREPRTKKEDRTVKHNFNEGLASEVNDKKGPVSVFSPTSFSDVEIIIDSIRAGKNAVVHLTELKTETAIRVLDMLSGAIYALNGGVYEMGKNVFMFSPSGVEVY